MKLPALLLFLSGAAALVFEALWFHQAAIALGNDVAASSCVLAAFMGGNALGGLLAPRLAQHARDRGRMLRVYAGLELLVGAIGLTVVNILPNISGSLAAMSASLGDSGLAMNALRVVVALMVLGLPAIAMGATLPVLLTAAAPDDERSAKGPLVAKLSFGRALGTLYAANTLGAVVGVVGAELVLVPQLGVRGSALIAAAACCALAAFAAVGAQLAGPSPRVSVRVLPPADPNAASSERQVTPLLLAAGLSGFALLALETVWMRFLSLILNDTPLAFALVLAVVLAGIAVGGALAAAIATRVAHVERFASVVAAAAGVSGIGGYYAYTALIGHTFTFDQDAWTVLLSCAPLVLPTCVLSGALYTLLGAKLRTSGDRELRAPDTVAAGKLAFANTIGAAVGALAGGLLLLPRAGMERSFIFLCASYGVIALLLAPRPGMHSKRFMRLHVGAGVALVLAIALFPFGDVRSRFVASSVARWMTAEDRIASVAEGRTATLVHVEHRQGGLAVFDQIATNAYSMTVNDFAARRYMKLFAYLPIAIHPKIERALVVGYGLGSTARAILDDTECKQLDVVDTEPKLLALARSIPPKAGGDPLADPRTRVYIDDGRHFVQLAAARSTRYDLITGEPPPPILAGVVHLYTREYFALLRSALREGGMVSYWLPMMNLSASSGRAIVRSFCQVFDDCSLWHGTAKNFMLLGSNEGATKVLQPREPVSVERFTRLFRTGALRLELSSIGLEHASQLGALFIGDARYLNKLVARDGSLTDDWPRRMASPIVTKSRDALLWEWRDTKAARTRFEGSAFIKQRFPKPLRQDALRHFEGQRLTNDLLFSVATAARQLAVLQQVLERTPLAFPVLLMLNSNPDIQAALRHLPPTHKRTVFEVRHELSGRLAARDYEGAWLLARRLKDEELPLPGLRAYIERAAQTER